jgi:hypothetical protein
MTVTNGGNRRLYGTMITVDGEGYLDAVDKSPPESVVIVYVYDDRVRFVEHLAHSRILT